MKIILGIEKIMDVVRSINKYLEIKAPWTAYKNDCKKMLKPHCTQHPVFKGCCGYSSTYHAMQNVHC